MDICINDKGKINKKPQVTFGYAPTLVSEFHGNLPKVVEVRGAAMRGRYNSDGKTEQQIEVRDDELSNAITTVNKDSLVVEKRSWLEKKYAEFYKKHGYVPEYFVPYDGTETTDYAPTLTANSNTSPTHTETVLITEIDRESLNTNNVNSKENFQKPPTN